MLSFQQNQNMMLELEYSVILATIFLLLQFASLTCLTSCDKVKPFVSCTSNPEPADVTKLSTASAK